MGNEMGNNNTTGTLHEESDGSKTEVDEKSLLQRVRNHEEEGENHAVPVSENMNIDEKETVLASDGSNGTEHDRVPDESSNERELNVKEADSAAVNHKNEKSIGEAVNDEDSEIQSNSFAKKLEHHENSEIVSVSDENRMETSPDKLQKQISFSKDDAKGESHVVPSSESKSIERKETVLASIDSNGTGDDRACSKASDAEEPNLTKVDPPVENYEIEMTIDEDTDIKTSSLAKELEDHEKSIERVSISIEDHLETNAKLSRNSEIKEDDELGSSIANNPVKENDHYIDTCLVNKDETVVSGSDLDVEEKSEELSATKMASPKSEMQFEVKPEGNDAEFMSTTILSLNSASDDAEKCVGKSINEVESQENNCLELHQEVMAESQNSFVEDLPEDKCMVLTEETKLVKNDSEIEGNKQNQNNPQSNEELVIQSNTDETSVSNSAILLGPDGEKREKNEPDSYSSDHPGNNDFKKQENVADSDKCVEASEENSREFEEVNVEIAKFGMLPPELRIPCRGENADEANEFKTKDEELEEIKPEDALINEDEIKENENIEYVKFQSLLINLEPSPSASLIHCQDSQQETAVLFNVSQSSRNSTLESKPESCELPDAEPTIFHGRSLTMDFLCSSIEITVEKPMPVAVNFDSVNPEMVQEAKSSFSSHQSIDRYDVEASLQAKDSFAEAAESVARSSTESNPNGFNTQMRKSPSFSIDLRKDEMSGESDRTPLLYHDKITIKPCQSDTTAQYPLRHSQSVQQSLESQTTEPEEKLITQERSDSEKSRTPFIGFLKHDEEDHITLTPKEEENQGDYCKSGTKELSSSPAKLKQKHNKRRSSLFANCMCCTTVIN